jgi:hypothetical protein
MVLPALDTVSLGLLVAWQFRTLGCLGQGTVLGDSQIFWPLLDLLEALVDSSRTWAFGTDRHAAREPLARTTATV